MPVDSPVCPWLCSPDGPGTPFHGVLLACVDAVRLLCVAGGLLVLVLTVLVMLPRVRALGQHSRAVALVLFALAAVCTEAEHLGDYPSYRLLLNAVGVWLAVLGLVRFHRELPSLERAPVSAPGGGVVGWRWPRSRRG